MNNKEGRYPHHGYPYTPEKETPCGCVIVERTVIDRCEHHGGVATLLSISRSNAIKDKGEIKRYKKYWENAIKVIHHKEETITSLYKQLNASWYKGSLLGIFNWLNNRTMFNKGETK